jgi:hypothetical protein
VAAEAAAAAMINVTRAYEVLLFIIFSPADAYFVQFNGHLGNDVAISSALSQRKWAMVPENEMK